MRKPQRHYITDTRSATRQTGMSLIELMIAMLISLLLLGGTIQIFISNKQTYRLTEALSRVQENSRFAIEFLTRDLRMAGFWGCANLAEPVNHINAGAIVPDFGSGGMSGTDGASGAPDTIILRGATPNDITIEAPYMVTSSSDVHVSTQNGLNQGDIVIISDCTAADAFQITSANPHTSGSVTHNTGTGTPGNATKPLSKTYGADAAIYKAWEYQYFIQNNANGEPALYRAVTSSGTSEELVEGIENLQILYGEDTADADTAANYYVPLGSVTDMDNVVSVRITIIARSDDNIASTTQNHSYDGTTDRRLRQTFTTTIGIRNRL